MEDLALYLIMVAAIIAGGIFLATRPKRIEPSGSDALFDEALGITQRLRQMTTSTTGLARLHEILRTRPDLPTKLGLDEHELRQFDRR